MLTGAYRVIGREAPASGATTETEEADTVRPSVPALEASGERPAPEELPDVLDEPPGTADPLAATGPSIEASIEPEAIPPAPEPFDEEPVALDAPVEPDPGGAQEAFGEPPAGPEPDSWQDAAGHDSDAAEPPVEAASRETAGMSDEQIVGDLAVPPASARPEPPDGGGRSLRAGAIAGGTVGLLTGGVYTTFAGVDWSGGNPLRAILDGGWPLALTVGGLVLLGIAGGLAVSALTGDGEDEAAGDNSAPPPSDDPE